MAKYRGKLLDAVKLICKDSATLSELYFRYIIGWDIARRFCLSDTDLCIEGYPGSANTYFSNMVKMLNVNYKISSFTHTVGNLKKAKRFNIFTIFIIRPPEDCISSRVIRFEKSNSITINTLIREYVHLYKYVSNIPSIHIVDFYDIIQDPSLIFFWLGDQGLLFYGIENVDAVAEQVKNQMALFGKAKQEAIQIRVPMKDREDLKKQVINEVKKYRKFTHAKQYYVKLMNRIKYK